MERWVKWTLIILFAIGVILCIALPLAAQKTLESTEVGFNYNATTKKMDVKKLYKSGRHGIGVSNKFVKYQTNIKTLEFTEVSSRTKDGLNIKLSINFQYRLNINAGSLSALFYKFPYNSYVSAYKRFCRNVFRDATSEFVAYDFIDKRTQIQSRLNTLTQEKLDKYGSQVENFQLLDITFPTNFQATISDAQNARLEVENIQNDLENAKQDKQAKETKAQVDKQIIGNEAETESLTIQENAKQRIKRLEARLFNLKEVNDLAIENLSLDAGGLIKYNFGQSIDTISKKSSGSFPMVLKNYRANVYQP